MAGYSGTPLPKKLGVKESSLITIIDPPMDFEKTLGELPTGAQLRTGMRSKGPFDVIVLFAKRERDLRKRLDAARSRLAESGGLWIAWPKKSSGVETDLSDGVVREIGLATGLVDNKVCAIDETWSGLRFVVRVRDRRR